MPYIKKERPYAPRGTRRMPYLGCTEVDNQFGGKSLEHRFEDTEYQAKILTRTAWLPGNSLDDFARQITGQDHDIDAEIDLDAYIGRQFDLTIEEVNSLSRVISVTPVAEEGSDV